MVKGVGAAGSSNAGGRASFVGFSVLEITGSNLDDGSPVNFKLDRNTSIGDVLCTGSRVTHRSCVFKNARLHVATKTIIIHIAVPEHMDLREVLEIFLTLVRAKKKPWNIFLSDGSEYSK